jgi:hypothetical protein
MPDTRKEIRWARKCETVTDGVLCGFIEQDRLYTAAEVEALDPRADDWHCSVCGGTVGEFIEWPLPAARAGGGGGDDA